MKIAPYIDPGGIARERERAACRAELITEPGGRFLIAFVPAVEDGLTCLELVRVFSIALHPPKRRGRYGARYRIALRPASWCCIPR